MQRERGKKRDSSKKKQRFGRSAKSVGSGRSCLVSFGLSSPVWSVSGGGGWEKGRLTEKAERELSSKQEKAKGKGQESRHQKRFPPLFAPRPPQKKTEIGYKPHLSVTFSWQICCYVTTREYWLPSVSCFCAGRCIRPFLVRK